MKLKVIAKALYYTTVKANLLDLLPFPLFQLIATATGESMNSRWGKMTAKKLYT